MQCTLSARTATPLRRILYHSLSSRQHHVRTLSQRCNADLQPLVQVFDLNHYPPADMPLSVEPARPGKELSQRINALVQELRQGSEIWQTCFVIRQGEVILPCNPPSVSVRLALLLGLDQLRHLPGGGLQQSGPCFTVRRMQQQMGCTACLLLSAWAGFATHVGGFLRHADSLIHSMDLSGLWQVICYWHALCLPCLS